MIKKAKSLPNIVKILVLQQFFEGFIPITALYAIMFERVGGLDFQQIGVLFSIWSIAFLVVELPSGVLADYWSRRNIIILGGVLRSVGFAVWLMFPSFLGYAVGFALWGAMIACSSGAINAYLHTELEHEKQIDKYAKYYGWMATSTTFGMFLGFITASIFTLDFSSVLIGASIVSSLFGGVILVLAKEHPYKKQDTYLKTLKAGLVEIRSSSLLRYICYVMFAVYMIIGVLEELLPRIFASFGLTESAISLVLAVTLVLTIYLLTKLESLVKVSLSKQALIMVGGMVFLMIGLIVGSLTGVVLALIFNLIFHFFRIFFAHHIQHVVQSEERATVGSIPGLAGGLLGAGAYAVIGVVSGFTSENFSIGAYGFFWFIVLLLLALIGRKYTLSRKISNSKNDNEPIEIPAPATQG